METNGSSDFSTSAARRLAFWGPTIAGFLGLILTINASLDGEYVGAGALLIASTLAFGAIGYVFLRK